jgi:hypothetical protein
MWIHVVAKVEMTTERTEIEDNVVTDNGDVWAAQHTAAKFFA